jgi:hypothetical protein
MASELCDVTTYRVRGRDKGETADYPVATPGMIRRLPKRRALVLRGDAAPVITHLPMVWNDWRYRWANLRGHAVVEPSLTARDLPEPTAAAPPDAEAPDPVFAGAGTVNGNGNGHRDAHPWDLR